ncbi:DUF808 domain-containing protein [Planctobacterium marinum]|uniref:DUF808 domain-containing protein n=1 Tax=Planctobacterium marinum TaxID=1631968 RepID=UPI001E38B8EC|nr:DUF808 domain-containing protein [Planctobacterium marinum]MCC2604741.1 DUF808 domain-containing protein [Planctobacterium marinum]
MAASSLLALIDDIATILDDVAVMSKVAAKKTAGVLGDDLALNAEQVSGVKSERELPVVWAVAKGSFLNKFILVPSALLISAFYPPLIIVLLVIGGLYLCFEGFEKVFHKLFHAQQDKEHDQALLQAAKSSAESLKAFEQKKIKGAIRTDFILSAEIIVIVLGTVQHEPMLQQILVLSGLALAFTVGVYGLVAGIVKLDDLGLYLLESGNKLKTAIGRGLLAFAPFLMKTLSVVGTLAMFLVGGGILVHDVPFLHHMEEALMQTVSGVVGTSGFWAGLVSLINSLVVGVIAGGLCLLLWCGVSRFRVAS